MKTALFGYLLALILILISLIFAVSKIKIKNPIKFIGFILATSLLPLIAGYLYFISFPAIPETRVPDVIGLDERSGIERIEAFHLKAKIEFRGGSSVITGQRPSPGDKVKFGRVVNIIVGGNQDYENISSEATVTEEVDDPIPKIIDTASMEGENND